MQAFRRRFIPVAFTLAAAALSSGCTDDNVTIFIRQVQVPDAEDKCTVQADPTGLFRDSGLLDTAVGGGYFAVVLVGNQMAQRGDSDTLRPETGRVQLYEAEVTVYDSAGGTLAGYRTPISGFADPATGTEPGWGLTGVTMVDAGTAAAAGNQVLVSRVKLYGTSLGGVEVETGDWDFPIEVCNGCLVGACIEPSTCEDDRVKVCGQGQDAAPDCRDVIANHKCN